jgi:NTE family protein
VTRRLALVLGGGGVAGIAWQTGVVAALADAGLDLSEADAIVGTSAGATVAAQVASDTTAGDWYRRQVDPALQNKELRPTGMSSEELWGMLARLTEEFPDPVERRRRIGAMALAAPTATEAVRRAVVAGRLPGGGWPERPIAIVAVDAATGARRVFDSGSGVELVDAVAASSAVPGVWPPVTIGPSRYVDGGIDSLCNADLVVGHSRVLVLAPMADPPLEAQVSAIDARGRALVVTPDGKSVEAFGADPLDPEVRAPSARAGRAQGRMLATSVLEFWHS